MISGAGEGSQDPSGVRVAWSFSEKDVEPRVREKEGGERGYMGKREGH